MVTISLRTHQPCSGTEEMMGTKLERIAEISATTPKPEFTSLYHLINAEMLLQCHKELDGNKAMGVDKVSKAEYAEHLEENITNLVERLKKKAYKPLPSLRVYIPKGNGKMRPLGIASYEDKIVQLAVKKILEAIYEPRFLNCMYGFRRNRGCHDAVKKVHYRINGWINYVVDADIKGFFDHMSHEWLMKFLNLYIKDTNLLWLIKKYLKAGVITEGVFEDSEEGSAQGNIISPVLANIYMHNVLALWFKFVVLKETSGKSFLTMYADDFIAGFQYKADAEKYYALLKERLRKFNLELEESKSRLIEFGRFAESNCKRRGDRKPETFDYLGFTFYCGKGKKNGNFCVKLKTSRKKYTQKLKAMKEWLYANNDLPVKELIAKLNKKLIGHYRYYGISFNIKKLGSFLHFTQRYLCKALNRRSQMKSYTWDGFADMLKVYPLAKPKIYVKLF